MSIDHNLFTSKLNELDAEYTQMLSRLKLCYKGTMEEICDAKEELLRDCKAQESGLEEAISSSKSQAMLELSKLQLQYFQESRIAVTEKLPQYLNAMNFPTDRSRAEAMALHAEFAIDNAVQSMRYALHAALSAVELQLEADQLQTC